MPEHNPGQMGGTMRLGKRRTLFQTKNSVMSKSCLELAQPLAFPV
jgi:CTP synthase